MDTDEHRCKSLSALYREGWFPGGLRNQTAAGDVHEDRSSGTVSACHGQEWSARRGRRVYDLPYTSGLIE
jgi:hypothetical protein